MPGKLLGPLLSALALALPLAAFSSTVGAVGVKGADIRPVPDFRWKDKEGMIHHLSDSHGEPRLLHFWAAWCIPCRKEMPQMLEWKRANPDVQVVALSLDQRMAQAKYFIEKYQLDMPPLLVEKKDRKGLAIPGLPYTLLVTQEGNLVGRVVGIADWEEDTFGSKVREHLGL